MQKLTRGTTPKIFIELPPEIGLADIAELWLTLSQKGEQFTKSLNDMTLESDGRLSVTLSQTETLRLSDCGEQIRVQARIRTVSGEAAATDIIMTSAGSILKDGEI